MIKICCMRPDFYVGLSLPANDIDILNMKHSMQFLVVLYAQAKGRLGETCTVCHCQLYFAETVANNM